ncbi:MAG TPA: ClpXP protease specificity-enhancing factor SspB [Caulobacteraceae bacterium]|nr:ClpXP protease specificity-enhancing factor SspB [Caulobacteraceae bacterium]
MAQEKPPQDLMHYDQMAQDALRGVVRAALKRAAAPAGLPGDHHFYITFKTAAPGVSGPPDLLARYPDDMTIALQHRFWDLAPGETFFSVTLEFSGEPKRLSVPYAAVTRFSDPSVGFGLQFDVPEPPPAKAEPPPKAAAAPPPSDEPKVVSLDQFRKK